MADRAAAAQGPQGADHHLRQWRELRARRRIFAGQESQRRGPGPFARRAQDRRGQEERAYSRGQSDRQLRGAAGVRRPAFDRHLQLGLLARARPQSRGLLAGLPRRPCREGAFALMRRGDDRRFQAFWLTKSVRSRAPFRLERDDFSSNRHPTLALWWSMILFRKPVPTLGSSPRAGFFGIML